MQITKTLALAGAVLAFSGCQSVDVTRSIGREIPTYQGTRFTAASTKRCPEGNCFLKITVIDCAAGRFSIDGEVLDLGGRRGVRTVNWLIQDAGYEFTAADPLDPKGSSAFFGRPTVAGAALVARVRVDDPRVSHEYGLNIVKTDGPACRKFDPWVIE
jgi:hypothetical protein